MTVPEISADDLLAFVRELFPEATATYIPMNPQYQSWWIEIRKEGLSLDVSWGPLSGFGGTDILALKEDDNPFAPYDLGFDSLQAAKMWLQSKKEQNQSSQPTPLKRRG